MGAGSNVAGLWIGGGRSDSPRREYRKLETRGEGGERTRTELSILDRGRTVNPILAL